jgi:hypothetical protein
MAEQKTVWPKEIVKKQKIDRAEVVASMKKKRDVMDLIAEQDLINEHVSQTVLNLKITQ